MTAADYENNVFINCPFDQKHTPLFRAMVFAVHDCGFIARCALETEGTHDVRIIKIMQIVRESRYAIHDISRVERDRRTRLPRFNMPLELGIFMGAKEFGSAEQRLKRYVVLDRDQYRYRDSCSDIAGQDIQAHGDDPFAAIVAVNRFLTRQQPGFERPSPRKMCRRYEEFTGSFPPPPESTTFCSVSWISTGSETSSSLSCRRIRGRSSGVN
ncbi:MAG TPA: hypothetical protein VF541_11600 [Longimicrobium sp.]|jgi:hypothetical protein